MGMKTGGGTGARPDINLTPLIDVLLVLLIIFMVVGPPKPHEFETKVPERPPQTDMVIIPDPTILVVSLEPKTLQLKLNNDELTPEALYNRLSDELSKRPPDKRQLFIKAPKTVPYREVIRIVDLAKGAGAEPIGLQIDFLED